ncbi:SRPBCC family protein [Chryseobacterium sp. A321]
MKPHRTTFTLDKEFKSVVIKRVFNASLESLWNAFTEPEQLNKWWAPLPYQVDTKSSDLSVGGRWIYAMVSPEGDKHWGTVEYLTLDKPNHLVWIDWFSDENGNRITEMHDSHWDLRFENNVHDQDYVEGELRTDLTISITHKRYEDLEKLLEMGFKEGITQTLDQLDDLLTRGSF